MGTPVKSCPDTKPIYATSSRGIDPFATCGPDTEFRPAFYTRFFRDVYDESVVSSVTRKYTYRPLFDETCLGRETTVSLPDCREDGCNGNRRNATARGMDLGG
jgi:hypothetical protein